jgi:hypothetical protein
MIWEGMCGSGCGIYEDAGVVEGGILQQAEGSSLIGVVLQEWTINQV